MPEWHARGNTQPILRFVRNSKGVLVTRSWLAIALLFQGTAPSEVIRFDHAAQGSLPAGWSVAMTHAGGAPKWEIVRDDSAPHPPLVLAQLSRDPTAGRQLVSVGDAPPDVVKR